MAENQDNGDGRIIELLKALSMQNESISMIQRNYDGDAEEKRKAQELVEKVNIQELGVEDIHDLIARLRNCGSCPLMNYTNPSSNRPMCKNCILSFLGLLIRLHVDGVELDGGMQHNTTLGYLLSSISNLALAAFILGSELNERQRTFDEEKKEFEIRRNKRRANFYKRKEKYIEKWVMANPKPTKKALAKELEISYEQLLRDFKELGY